ncbi:MAG: D-glycero-beta-D-manno-heptose 1,7-bisphosphate 7-phosphatase [Campylobacterales bacterium]|nr:D-glycero-beta-D-manno-heptose 1,7-bisphosphate 7-phosphatase [Campylobacterales bacterium]
MEKVLFLDRDGVINYEKDYLYKIEDFEFVEGVFQALQFFQDRGFKIVVITNQSGIARGYYTQDDFDKLTNWMIEIFKTNGIDISGVFYCPHGPNEQCSCRKPMTGMIDQAKKLFEIDFQNSWLVGDKQSDIELAINSNIQNSVQVRSGHCFDSKKSKAKYVLDSIAQLPSVFSVK